MRDFGSGYENTAPAAFAAGQAHLEGRMIEDDEAGEVSVTLLAEHWYHWTAAIVTVPTRMEQALERLAP